MGTNCSENRGDPRLPVDQASWFDAQEFCERLCQRHRPAFRLPSEAEWEYACRAGTATKYAFGDTLSPAQANFKPYATMFRPLPSSEEELMARIEQAADAGRDEEQTTPVDTYPPNAWGLYDMHGNVMEWYENVWHPSYGGAPTDGCAWLDGEDKNAFRVVRGGWASATEFVCTSSYRTQLRADAGMKDDGGTRRDAEPAGQHQLRLRLQ